MKMILQRVKAAQVEVRGKTVGRIKQGWLVLLGVSKKDNFSTAQTMCEKVLKLRCFDDEQGRMNHSITEINGSVLLISQFTLYADCSRGKRPNFNKAANKEYASHLYNEISEYLSSKITLEKGTFGENMKISADLDGPVSIILDSENEV